LRVEEEEEAEGEEEVPVEDQGVALVEAVPAEAPAEALALESVALSKQAVDDLLRGMPVMELRSLWDII